VNERFIKDFTEYISEIANSFKGVFTSSDLIKKMKLGDRRMKEIIAELILSVAEEGNFVFFNPGKNKSGEDVYMGRKFFENRLSQSFGKAESIIDENETHSIFEKITGSKEYDSRKIIQYIKNYTSLIRFDERSRSGPLTLNLYRFLMQERDVFVTQDTINLMYVRPFGEGVKKEKFSLFSKKKEENSSGVTSTDMVRTAFSLMFRDLGQLIIRKRDLFNSTEFRRYFSNIDLNKSFDEILKTVYNYGIVIDKELISLFPENWLDLDGISRQLSKIGFEKGCVENILSHYSFLNQKEKEMLISYFLVPKTESKVKLDIIKSISVTGDDEKSVKNDKDFAETVFEPDEKEESKSLSKPDMEMEEEVDILMTEPLDDEEMQTDFVAEAEQEEDLTDDSVSESEEAEDISGIQVDFEAPDIAEATETEEISSSEENIIPSEIEEVPEVPVKAAAEEENEDEDDEIIIVKPEIDEEIESEPEKVYEEETEEIKEKDNDFIIIEDQDEEEITEDNSKFEDDSGNEKSEDNIMEISDFESEKAEDDILLSDEKDEIMEITDENEILSKFDEERNDISEFNSDDLVFDDTENELNDFENIEELKEEESEDVFFTGISGEKTGEFSRGKLFDFVEELNKEDRFLLIRILDAITMEEGYFDLDIIRLELAERLGETGLITYNSEQDFSVRIRRNLAVSYEVFREIKLDIGDIISSTSYPEQEEKQVVEEEKKEISGLEDLSGKSITFITVDENLRLEIEKIAQEVGFELFDGLAYRPDFAVFDKESEYLIPIAKNSSIPIVSFKEFKKMLKIQE